MPTLTELTKTYADLSDRFQIVGIHEGGDLETLIHVEVTAKHVAKRLQRPSKLLPDMILDIEQGMFLTYDPDGLGDTVLLDERGFVVASGDSAKTMLVSRLDSMRVRVTRASAHLQGAKRAKDIEEGVKALYALDLPGATEGVAEFLESCSGKNAEVALAAVFKFGGQPGLALLGSSDGLGSEDSKRQDAVLTVLEAAPQPGLTSLLRSYIQTPKIKDKLLCRALVTLVKGDPNSRTVHKDVLRLSEDKDTTIRRCAAELLGTVGTTKARERIMKILTKDRSVPVRRHAMLGLALFADDEAKDVITKISTEARAGSMRALAEELLAKWE